MDHGASLSAACSLNEMLKGLRLMDVVIRVRISARVRCTLASSTWLDAVHDRAPKVSLADCLCYAVVRPSFVLWNIYYRCLMFPIAVAKTCRCMSASSNRT